MKISFASDIHLEFGDITINNIHEANILILSGDIMIASHLFDLQESPRWSRSFLYHKFFANVCDQFDKVYYIMGNHEHYDHEFTKTIPRIQEHFSYLKNLFILDNSCVPLSESLCLFGGTLWTNLNGKDPLTLHYIKDYMSDFHVIQMNGQKFSPMDSINEFERFLVEAQKALDQNKGKDFIFATHHSPSFVTSDVRFKDEFYGNGAFMSDLDNFILDNENIKVWISGHQHHRYDIKIGDCRLLNNSRGYCGHEKQHVNSFCLMTISV